MVNIAHIIKSGTQQKNTGGKECATTASNYSKILLNVSVMLQCTANTATVKSFYLRGKERWRRGGDKAIKRMRKTFQTAEVPNPSQSDNTFFLTPVTTDSKSSNKKTHKLSRENGNETNTKSHQVTLQTGSSSGQPWCLSHMKIGAVLEAPMMWLSPNEKTQQVSFYRCVKKETTYSLQKCQTSFSFLKTCILAV